MHMIASKLKSKVLVLCSALKDRFSALCQYIVCGLINERPRQVLVIMTCFGEQGANVTDFVPLRNVFSSARAVTYSWSANDM